jgi:hypothetical protein
VPDSREPDASGTGLDPFLLTGRGITLGSISVGSRTNFEAVNRAIDMHRLRSVIDRTFLFAGGEGGLPAFRGPLALGASSHHLRQRALEVIVAVADLALVR